MNIDAAGLEFIKSFEGYSATVYNDVAGKPTIGYGHLLRPGDSYPDGITEAQALVLLAMDVAPVSAAVDRMAPLCNQNQHNALCSFAYNLGVGALQQMLNHGWAEIPEQILRWTHSGGVVIAGLVRRRQAEVDLFCSTRSPN